MKKALYYITNACVIIMFGIIAVASYSGHAQDLSTMIAKAPFIFALVIGCILGWATGGRLAQTLSALVAYITFRKNDVKMNVKGNQELSEQDKKDLELINTLTHNIVEKYRAYGSAIVLRKLCLLVVFLLTTIFVVFISF